MVTLYEDKEKEKGQEPSDGKLSPFVLEFLKDFEASHARKKGTLETTIKVSQVFGSLARLYERIRTTVEYKGESVLRRNAIDRILKRLVWEKESLRPNINSEKIAETLVKELIWARYLPNDNVPKSIVRKVEVVIEKYLYLLSNKEALSGGIHPSSVRTWIWGVASSEIEDLVDPSQRELYVNLMYRWFTDFFEWKDEHISEHEKKVQMYLAIHRSFTKSDEAIMRYHLLLREFPNWENAGKAEVNEFISRFPKLYSEIEEHLNFRGRLALFRKVQKHSAAFEIFRAVAGRDKLDLRKTLENDELLEEKIRTVCEDKYKNIRSRVRTGIVRSIIYIFLTKVIFALFLEVPYEVYRYGDVRYLPLSINIMFPPLMMFLIGMSISTPGEKNTLLIISRLKSVVYGDADTERQEFSTVLRRGSSTLIKFFGFLYAVLFVLVFGGISYLLLQINFTFFGILVFFVFLSLVLLFAFRVRFNARQLKVEGEEEDMFGHFFSYLTLPFLNLGFYLSKGLSKLNFFTVILDFLIEAPLKNIIEIFEEWTSFLREKKEEVVEIPE